jgi:hypothetical protein
MVSAARSTTACAALRHRSKVEHQRRLPVEEWSMEIEATIDRIRAA